MNDPRARHPRIHVARREAQPRFAPLAALALLGLLALLLAACSSPTPSRPGAPDPADEAPIDEVDGGGESSEGGSLDYGRATQVPPGGGEEFIRRTITVEESDEYPPPPSPTPTSPYPGPDESGGEASEDDAGGDG